MCFAESGNPTASTANPSWSRKLLLDFNLIIIAFRVRLAYIVTLPDGLATLSGYGPQFLCPARTPNSLEGKIYVYEFARN